MATKTTKPNLTIAQLNREFATDEQCKALLKQLRWPDGVVKCARCNSGERISKTSNPYRWKCKTCNKQGYTFSVITRTVFENTNMPLRTWFKVAFLMLSSKKGMSALQVYRMMDPVRGEKGSYKTAWYMCMRIRAAMNQGGMFPGLGGGGGVVEVDETYIGGKEGNKHFHKRHHRGPKAGKVAVVGAIARKGNVVCQAVERVSAGQLTKFVKSVVAGDVKLVVTDDNPSYDRLALKDGIPHESVNHTQHEYVRGEVHTASIDNFWSMVKRGIVGNFHHVSAGYLPLYLNEFSWRYNHRHDKEAFHTLLRGC